jgi:hypothetical protein
MPTEQLQFSAMLHSLDFPGRSALRADEIAAKLGVTTQHILDLVDEGILSAIDVRGVNSTRRCLRVPVEAYRDWLCRCLTNPCERRQLLRDLPKATLRELRRELDQLLAA